MSTSGSNPRSGIPQAKKLSIALLRMKMFAFLPPIFPPNFYTIRPSVRTLHSYMSSTHLITSSFKRYSFSLCSSDVTVSHFLRCSDRPSQNGFGFISAAYCSDEVSFTPLPGVQSSIAMRASFTFICIFSIILSSALDH